MREHLEERRERKASKHALTDKSDYGTSLVGVNLRDVGAVTHGPMRKGALFRSSELLRFVHCCSPLSATSGSH